ncbi:hypothetical protein [Microbacterium paulum]
MGLPWQGYGGEGGTEGRIRHERARRDELGIPSGEITRRVLAEFVRHGTTAIRTHVDVDPGVGLRGIEAVHAAVAEYDGALTVQIVAFPQDGVLELLADAARAGADHWVDWIRRRSTATRSVRSTPCWDSPPSTAWGSTSICTTRLSSARSRSS